MLFDGQRLPPSRGSASWLILCVLAIVHVPLLWLLSVRLAQSDAYSFFPLVLVGGAYLAYRRWPGRTELSEPHGGWLASLWVVALGTCFIAVTLQSPWIAGVSALLCTWAGLYSYGGRGLTGRLWQPWAFLWIALPLPLRFDETLTTFLQFRATEWASGVLDWIGIHHLVSGVVIHLPSETYMIEEACSGIHSLVAVVACTLFYAIETHRGVFRTLSLVAVSIFWVIVANAARVTAVIVLDDKMGWPVTDGLGHTALGILVFIGSLVLIASTDRLVLFAFPSRSQKHGTSSAKPRTALKANVPAETSEAMPPNSIVQKPRIQPRFLASTTAMAAVVTVIAVIQLGASLGYATAESGLSGHFSDHLRLLAMPETLPGGWRLSNSRDDAKRDGQISRKWIYQKDGLSATVCLDGPFTYWHDMTRCMEGQGWYVANSVNSAAVGADYFVEASLQAGLNRLAYAVFGCFDERFQAMLPPRTDWNWQLFRRLSDGASNLNSLLSLFGVTAGESRDTFQILVYGEGYVELTEQQRDELRKLFRECREAIRRNGGPIAMSKANDT